MFKNPQKTDGTTAYMMDVDGKNQRIDIDEFDDYITADLSYMSKGSGGGGKAYEELFELSSSANKRFKTDSLQGHNTYRFYVNVLKRISSGKDISHIMKEGSDEPITNKFMKGRIRTLLTEFENGDTIKGEALLYSKANLNMMRSFVR